jgi:hypothetical protein
MLKLSTANLKSRFVFNSVESLLQHVGISELQRSSFAYEYEKSDAYQRHWTPIRRPESIAMMIDYPDLYLDCFRGRRQNVFRSRIPCHRGRSARGSQYKIIVQNGRITDFFCSLKRLKTEQISLSETYLG